MEIKRTFDVPLYQLENIPLENSFVSKKNNIWNYLSTQKYIKKVDAFSIGLMNIGIKKGDKIAIISENRTEWKIVDLAIQQIGSIVVPIYPDISDKDYEYIFKHAEIRLCIISNSFIYQKIKHLKHKIPSLEEIYSLNNIIGIKYWRSILSDGYKNKNKISELELIKNSIKQDDISTIIYTSGTTGTPKGVIISHKNIISGLFKIVDRVTLNKYEQILSFLPLSHIFENISIYVYMYYGCPIYFSSPDNISRDIKEVKPYFMTTVPRVLEKIYDKIYNKGKKLPFVFRNIFFWAIKIGKNYDFSKRGIYHNITLFLAKKIIFNRWKHALGGNLRSIISGGAALQDRLCRIFNATGIRVMQGYGLTETCAVVSLDTNIGNDIKMGYVGRSIVDDIKINNDGEIMVKGDNVMLGYYKDEDKTKEVLKDGYFYTGDIGEIDKDGFLKITDRKKEMFKISGGKYVSPQYLENMMKESFFIENIIVIGEGKKFISAIVQLDFKFVKNWCQNKGIVISDYIDIVDNKNVKLKIQHEIKKKNTTLGDWEKIKEFRLSPDIWTLETGELTPTLKLRRKNILDKYKDIIDDIYSGQRNDVYSL